MQAVKLTKAQAFALRWLYDAKLEQCRLPAVNGAVPAAVLRKLHSVGFLKTEQPGFPPSDVVCLTDKGRDAVAALTAPQPLTFDRLRTFASRRLRSVTTVARADALLKALDDAPKETQQPCAAVLAAVPHVLRVAGIRGPWEGWSAGIGVVVLLGQGDRVPVVVMHPSFVSTRDLYGWLLHQATPKKLGRASLPTPVRWRYYVTPDGNDVLAAQLSGDMVADERAIMDAAPGKGWISAELEQGATA